ncbi:unnamed protein product [Sphagnum tenellum]
MRRSRGLTDTGKKQAICATVRRRLYQSKPEAAERSEIGDHRKRAGKTVHAKGRTTGKATWELDRLYGYAGIRTVRCLETWAIDGDWSRSCGCVSTILGTICLGVYRPLCLRANFQFYDASLINGPQPACLLAGNPAC